VKLIVDETKRRAQQEISRSVNPSTLHSRIMMYENVTADKMYMVLAFFYVDGHCTKAYT
jgi:hypothetical protein